MKEYVLSVAGAVLLSAVAALVALGVKLADADKAVRQAAASLGSENASTEALVKLALSK